MDFNEEFVKDVLSKEDVSADDKVTQIISAYNTSVNGLKVKNQELIGSEKKLKDSITDYETKKTDYEKQIESLTEQIKTASNDKTKEEFYNNEIAKREKTFNEKLKELTKERDEYKSYKMESLLKDSINKGIEGLHFGDDALKEGFIALVMSQHKFEPTDIDGKTVFLDSDKKQVSDVFKEFAMSEKGKSFIANGISGGGDKTPEVSTDNAKETKGKVDIAKIMQLYRSPSTRAMAKQMALEAGLKLY
jgi:hypothetical protein